MAGNGGSPIYVDGPWSHRPVTANGTRFHIAEAGEGPLVLLLHGFPQFWWTWRAQLESLSADQFARSATHPQWGLVSVDFLVQMYAWHCRHHVAHIRQAAERALTRSAV